jgi:hypothetical protein
MIFMTVLPPNVLVRHLDDDEQQDEVTVPDQNGCGPRGGRSCGRRPTGKQRPSTGQANPVRSDSSSAVPLAGRSTMPRSGPKRWQSSGIGVVVLDGLRLADHLVDDLGERRGRINRDAVLRSVFSGAMRTHDEAAFRRVCAELVFRQLSSLRFRVGLRLGGCLSRCPTEMRPPEGVG